MKYYEFYEQLKYFILTWMLLFVLSVSAYFFMNFVDIHLFINHFHSPFFDFFFKYFTYLGDGVVLAIFILIALFIKYREALNLSIMLVLSTLLAQSLKRIINLPRPHYYFTELLPSYLHYVGGVKLSNFHSFPSGHTTTAFVIFTYLSLRFFPQKKSMQILLLFIACLVGFSRVYLSQHFLHDTLAGSFIGILSVFITYSITEKWQNPKLNNSLLRK